MIRAGLGPLEPRLCPLQAEPGVAPPGDRLLRSFPDENFQESQCLEENGDNWVFLEQAGRAMNDLEEAGWRSEASPALPPLISFAETFIAASSSSQRLAGLGF